MNTVELVTTGLIYASWLAISTYLVAYWVVAPWWRTTIGRQMFTLGIAIWLISTLAVASQLFGQDYAARPVFRLIVWTATATVSVGLCVALYRAQIRKRK